MTLSRCDSEHEECEHIGRVLGEVGCGVHEHVCQQLRGAEIGRLDIVERAKLS